MISAVVLAKNEESNIATCVQSLLWCDEIIIIDDYSTDSTEQVVRNFHNKNISIYKKHLQNNFAEQRNYGQQKAKYEWVLFVDADERVTPSLQYEILSTINNSVDKSAGYYMHRLDVQWGRELRYGEAGNTKLLRLAAKNGGKWIGKVHEAWEIQGKKSTLKNDLLHYPHQNMANFIDELNFYTTIRANELFIRHRKVHIVEIVVYPCAKFLLNYILKLGFMDGLPGLVVCISMSMHSFLVRGKLWQLWKRKEQ